MKSSKTDLSIITPEFLANGEAINAWFTLKNDHYSVPESKIEGLNLGFNTPETESVVEQNRAALLGELDIDSEWVAYADQVHSNRVQVVSDGGTYGSTDGLITTLPGLTLVIQVADCAAVLLWDDSNYVIGAFHAGWRGAVADIVPKGIDMMKRHGAQAYRLKAFVSPCISQKNFEVGTEVAEQFPDAFMDNDSYRKPHVDLKGFLSKQLEDEGVKTSNIEACSECTAEGADDFYSYRREGEQSGRMMALIQIQR